MNVTNLYFIFFAIVTGRRYGQGDIVYITREALETCIRMVSAIVITLLVLLAVLYNRHVRLRRSLIEVADKQNVPSSGI